MDPYTWPLVDEFVNREEELARLEEWWASPERMPINMYGRRRVGKSWLLRRFAHGKPAVILASERLAPGTQLSRFAALLEPGLGVRPEIPDLPTLFRVAYRLASEAKALVVIDELPWLLPGTEAEIERALSSIQAVMEEERDSSQLKLVLCGSAISQMQALMSERGPLHGRLRALEIRPLRYPQAQEFLDTLDPVRRIERFAIAGGMPRYLSELGRGALENVICSRVLDRDGPLWNEARAVLEQELTQPGVYFSILEQLATGEKQVERIASGARIENTTVSRYLATLTELRIVHRKLPAGAAPSSRGGHWELSDPFLRFWFRFVFPFQAELESGLRARGPVGEQRQARAERPRGAGVRGSLPRLDAHALRTNGAAGRQLVGQRPQRPAPHRSAQHRGDRHRRTRRIRQSRDGDRRVPLAQQSDGRRHPHGDRGLQAPRAAPGRL